jgi:hypothetical protein
MKSIVYTQVCLTSFLDLNPPNPLKKGAKTRILVPLEKGDLAAFLFGGSPRIKKRQDRGIHTNFAFLRRCV